MEKLRGFFGRRNERGIRTQPEAWRILKELIPENSRVMVVGANTSMGKDPSLAVVAQRVHKYGDVVLCDPKGGTASKQPIDFLVRGYGDALNYINELEFLKQHGVKVAVPTWLKHGGQPAYMQQTGLPDRSIDIIVDHNTSPFVAGHVINGNTNRFRHLYPTYCEYRRVLKKGGSILLFTTLKDFQLHTKEHPQGEIISSLQNAGFSLMRRLISDEYQLEVPAGLDNPGFLRGIRAFEPNVASQLFMTEENGQSVIKFAAPSPAHPDLLVCRL